jgi:hypothetical protein
MRDGSDSEKRTRADGEFSPPPVFGKISSSDVQDGRTKTAMHTERSIRITVACMFLIFIFRIFFISLFLSVFSVFLPDSGLF